MQRKHDQTLQEPAMNNCIRTVLPGSESNQQATLACGRQRAAWAKAWAPFALERQTGAMRQWSPLEKSRRQGRPRGVKIWTQRQNLTKTECAETTEQVILIHEKGTKYDSAAGQLRKEPSLAWRDRIRNIIPILAAIAKSIRNINHIAKS